MGACIVAIYMIVVFPCTDGTHPMSSLNTTTISMYMYMYGIEVKLQLQYDPLKEQHGTPTRRLQ